MDFQKLCSDVQTFIQAHSRQLLIAAAVILGAVILILIITRSVRKFRASAAGSAFLEFIKLPFRHPEEFKKGVQYACTEEPPAPRSTGGMTSLLLPKIQKDFPDFHPEDADTDIETFLLEYLHIRYAGQSGFRKARISKRVALNLEKEPKGSLKNIQFHNTAVYHYQKTRNSATIRYRCSAGFDLNGERQEKLYEIEYTLQLRDECAEAAYLKCSNCGAPLTEEDEICPYCGIRFVRDTIVHWVVTGVKEL